VPRPSKNALPFDDRAIKAAKFEQGRERPLRGVPGLSLRLNKNDTAAFVFRYTSRGEQRRVVIGDRRVITKEHARERAIELGRQVRKGEDPAATQTHNADVMSLRALVDDFMEKADRPGPRTKRDYREALDRDVLSEIGERAADGITGAEIARVLQAVEARPPAYADRKRWRAAEGYRGTNAAHKARAALGSIYRWALKRRLVASNPCAGLGFIQRPVVRERKVQRDELTKLWTSLDTAPGFSRRMRILLRLIVLTGQRSTEVAGAQIGELELEGALPRWTIPAERMKRKRQQVIALSRQAVSLFREAKTMSEGNVVFPADEARGVRRLLLKPPRKPHIHGESVSKAMARLCQHAGIADLHVHDMRKALATWAGDYGVMPHVIDYILHHASRTTTGTHYDFSTMDPLVRPALQGWADHVEAAAFRPGLATAATANGVGVM
jgi:integrase